LIVATTSAALVAAGCDGQRAASSDQATQAAATEAPAPKVVHPEKKNVRRLIERPGFNIEAYEWTPLYARIPGYVQKWTADIGDRVRKDDLLAELYVPDMDAELKQKEAGVRQASSEIEQAETVILRAQAELDRARSQFERLSRVERSGVLDKEQVDETRLGFKAAEATLAKAKADVSVARTRLDVAKADRDHVQALMLYAKIRAPFDGVVTRRSINTGDFVQPADAGKGNSLFVVQNVDPVRVFVNIQEAEAFWVQNGDTALIRPQKLQALELKAKVTRTSRSLEPETRTLRTEIDLPNPEGQLLPGMYVNVTIIAEHKNVWALPATAVLTKGDETFCYRVENDKAVRMPIQVGLRGNEKDKELVEVLKKQIMQSPAGEEPRWEDFSGDEAILADAGSQPEGQATGGPSEKK
jgi:RND family efflux transporter MFP subunit